MEEEPIKFIRETNRNWVFLNRRKQKDEETDVRRSLENVRLNSSDIKAIVDKLKTKASISSSELKLLQNALIDEPRNVEVVLNTHGALRGLVRELTGKDVNKQIASCGCLCNLALGDSKACSAVAKAAGAYLVAALDTLTTQLAASCAWTLGNIAGSGARVCDVIVAQGALTKLCHIILTPGDVQEAAIYALTHVAYVLQDDLRLEHFRKIIESLSKADLNTDSCQLLFILSCHKEFTPDIIPEQFLNKILEQFTVSLKNHINICDNATSAAIIDTKYSELVFLVSVLANMNNGNVYSVLIDYFVSNNLVRQIRRLLEFDGDKSLWWLFGNMFNCCGDSVFFNQLIQSEV